MATCPAWLHYSHTVDPKSHWGQHPQIKLEMASVFIWVRVWRVGNYSFRCQRIPINTYRTDLHYITWQALYLLDQIIGYILDPMCDMILHILNQPLRFSTFKFRLILFRLAWFLWLLYTWTFRYYRRIQINHVSKYGTLINKMNN